VVRSSVNHRPQATGKSIFQRAKATAEHIAPVTSPAVSSGESDGGGASRRPAVAVDLSVVDERPDYSTAMSIEIGRRR
jgi:hypothetical protein